MTKIVSDKEWKQKRKELFDAEFTTAEKAAVKHARPLRKVGVLGLNVKSIVAGVFSANARKTMGTYHDKDGEYYMTAAGMEKFVDAGSNLSKIFVRAQLQTKLQDISARAFDACEDKSALETQGLIKTFGSFKK